MVFRGGGPSGKAAEGVEGVGGVTKLFLDGEAGPMGGSVASRILTVKTFRVIEPRVVCIVVRRLLRVFVCMSDLVLFIYSNVAIYSPSNRSPLARLSGESD